MRRLSGTRNMIIYFLVYCGSLLGQDYDLEGSYPRIIQPFHLPITQIAHPNNQAQARPGWFATLQYPGFASLIGEYSVGRTTETGNSFSIGIGWAYFAAEANLKLGLSRQREDYLNLIIGVIPAAYYDLLFDLGYFGSIGGSSIQKLSPSMNIQFSGDGFFHMGVFGQEIVQDTPGTIGLMWNNAVQKQMNDSFSISADIGLAFVAYRYYLIGNALYYTRWHKNEANIGKTVRWQTHLSFPLNLSIQYKF